MSETEIIVNQITALSYFGIFFVSIIGNVVVPVPEEIVLLAFGYIVGTGKVSFLAVLVLVVLGVLIGDIAMFILSRTNNRLVTFLYNKLFAKLLEKRGDAWIEKNIKKIIFFSRFMIQFRFIGPFLAGQKKVTFGTFLRYDLAAVLVYVPLYVLLGWYFHRKLSLIVENVHIAQNIILLVVGIALVFSVTRFLYRHLFGNKDQSVS
jgi:membrane-associated protein